MPFGGSGRISVLRRRRIRQALWRKVQAGPEDWQDNLGRAIFAGCEAAGRIRRAFWRKPSDMFTVYVLKSEKNGKRYIGCTSQPLSKRVLWHEQGATPWTRNNGPVKLIFSEEFSDKSTALKREKYLKTGQGRRTLDLLLASKVESSAPPESVAGPSKRFHRFSGN